MFLQNCNYFFSANFMHLWDEDRWCSGVLMQILISGMSDGKTTTGESF